MVVSLDVPGYSVDNVQINVTEERNRPVVAIEVHGERKNRFDEMFAVQERFIFKKERYDTANVSAVLVDGVLEIRVNKKPTPQPRLVPISIEKKDT